MKSITPELKTLLDTGRYTQADLFTLTAVTGGVTRITSMPGLSVTWASQTFAHDNFMIERGTISSKRHMGSLDVDNVEITIRFNAAHSLAGLSLPVFARNGGFDGARLLIQKAFCAVDSGGNTDPTATGVIYLFEGRLDNAVVGRSTISLKLIADTKRLDQMVPRNTINLNCMNTHYDSACGLDEADFTHPGTLDGVNSRSVMHALMTQAAGYFSFGRILFTSGQNAGALRSIIKWYADGTIVLSYPLDHMPQVGDGFSAIAGCDLLEDTCHTRFNNLPNRRCFKYVPAYEDNL